MLEVSRGAASMALAQLKKRGWVGEDPNRFLLLTDEGKRITRLVEHNFETLARFFEQILGADRDTAFSDACKMEHLMSMDTGRRMMALMRYLWTKASWRRRFAGTWAPSESEQSSMTHSAAARNMDPVPETRRTSHLHRAPRTLDQLGVGETGIVRPCGERGPSSNVCWRWGYARAPGIEVLRFAPMGDPVVIHVRGFSLALRKSEAALVELEN